MARTYRPLNGVLLFDKPLELSSNIALQRVRRLFQAEKAGHTGTLDPLATGLLPICFGEATKFSVALLDADKTYRALIKLGQVTTTGDAEGDIVTEKPVALKLSDVEATLKNFRGEIQQLPPMHSALKHEGKPLYSYIREGVTIERDLRDVVIHELVLHRFSGNTLEISVRCSKGTYIRTLAEDIGYALGCGAHLIGLRRTAIAQFSLENACTLEQLEVMSVIEREVCIAPVDALLQNIPLIELDATQAYRIAQGQRLAFDWGVPDGLVRLYSAGKFIGAGEVLGRRLAPSRLLNSVAKNAAK